MSRQRGWGGGEFDQERVGAKSGRRGADAWSVAAETLRAHLPQFPCAQHFAKQTSAIGARCLLCRRCGSASAVPERGRRYCSSCAHLLPSPFGPPLSRGAVLPDQCRRGSQCPAGRCIRTRSPSAAALRRGGPKVDCRNETWQSPRQPCRPPATGRPSPHFALHLLAKRPCSHFRHCQREQSTRGETDIEVVASKARVIECRALPGRCGAPGTARRWSGRWSLPGMPLPCTRRTVPPRRRQHIRGVVCRLCALEDLCP